MKNVCVDTEGELRCWNCGNKAFTEKRTVRSKVLLGTAALLTKKKLKCQVCGEYNDTGEADPYTGPASKKYRKMYEAELAAQSDAGAEVASGEPDAADQITKLMGLLEAGGITQEQFESQRDKILGAD
mgnify:CR=1 FL=1